MQFPLIMADFKPIKDLPEVTTLIPNANLLIETVGGDAFKISTEAFYQILNNFARPISPADAGPFTPNRWYKPTVSSADPGTNYPNAGSMKAKSGFDTLFFYDGTIWTKTEVELPGITASTTFDPDNNSNPSTMKAAADRYDPALSVLDFFVQPTDTIYKEYHWSDTDQTIYGVSPQGGILRKDGSLFVYSESGAEFKTYLNVPVSGNEILDLKIVRLGGNPSGVYCNLLGKKANGQIDVLITPVSSPPSMQLDSERFDINQYQTISFTLVNFTATNAGLNTDLKFIKKDGPVVEDAVLNKINSLVVNPNSSLNIIYPEGLVKGASVSGSVRTSNTNIINNCITLLISRGGGKIIIPAGDYCVGQIVIPDVQTWVNIEICGEFAPAQRFGTIVLTNVYDPNVLLPNGTVLISNAVSSGGVIDCSSGSSYQNFNMGKLTVRNLTVRTYENPQISGINAYYMFQLFVENVVVDTGVYNVKAIEPTYDRAAIVTPKDSNCAETWINHVSLQGYVHGIKVYEHTNADNLNIQSCKNALSFYFGSHSSNFNRCDFQRNTVQVNVVEEHVFNITQLNMEYAGGGQTTPENAWQATQWELYDPNNKGIANIHYANVRGNVGKVNTFRMSGASNIVVKRFGNDARITTTIP